MGSGIRFEECGGKRLLYFDLNKEGAVHFGSGTRHHHQPLCRGGVPQSYPTYVMCARGSEGGCEWGHCVVLFSAVTANVIVLFF